MPRASSRSSSRAPFSPAATAVELRGELMIEWYRRLRLPQLQRERDQPLLCAVVEVAFDLAPGLVGARDDARARGRESARAWAFAIAVATSSVNPARRSSVPGGGGSSPVDTTAMRPHSSPSTVIGTPTAERMPISRAAPPASSSVYRSTRAGRLVSRTVAVTVPLTG